MASGPPSAERFWPRLRPMEVAFFGRVSKVERVRSYRVMRGDDLGMVVRALCLMRARAVCVSSYYNHPRR